MDDVGGHSITAQTIFCPFLTTNLPLVNNLSKEKKTIYVMNINNWMITHLPQTVYVVVECLVASKAIDDRQNLDDQNKK